MKNFLIYAAAAVSLAVCGSANAATFTPADCKPGNIHFCVEGNAQGPNVDDYITGIFTNSFNKVTKINDTFLFRIDKNGIGSGGLQTSFSSKSTLLTISDLIINGVSYATTIVKTTAGTSVNVNSVVIDKGAMNTIQVLGSYQPLSKGAQANYTGNLTFTAAVPEASTWAMMILGFGFIGYVARRRKAAHRVNPALTA
ncbi:FxDxF family PEP-CTERM protein [Novosphingobium sp. M1R2S20]|uniref:FxDxF family PEP-CTERM protein n=1 Tax=Novosphingobium rhizovicinum TaxID=3228928 RepID=A0ABV3RCU5_9SPHN